MQAASVTEISGAGRRFGGIGRIAGFTLLTLGVMVASDRTFDYGLRQVRTSTFGVFNAIVDGRINASILITGSSRALNDFDPRVIQRATAQSAFNIGIDGSQTDMQVAVFKTYLKHNRKPELLVHCLDSFAFVTSRSGVDFPGLYVPYLKQEDALYEALDVVDPNTWKTRHLPLYGYAQDMNFIWLRGIGGLFGLNPAEDRYQGFMPRHASWNEEFVRFKEQHAGGVQFAIEPEGIRAFEDLLKLSQENAIPVLLVYAPVYYEMQALETNRDEIFRRFKETAARYHASFWDYSRSPIFFKKDYFVNSQHLNDEGAAVFSADFAAALAGSALVDTK